MRNALPRRVADLVDRVVSLEELRAATETPLTVDEREAILSLSRWFCRRYPTPAQRLAYVRRAYQRWLDGHQRPRA